MPEEGDEMTKPRLGSPIDELRLDTRVENLLRGNGLTTIGKIVMSSKQRLIEIPNFGPKSYAHLCERLAEVGYEPPREGPKPKLSQWPDLSSVTERQQMSRNTRTGPHNPSDYGDTW